MRFPRKKTVIFRSYVSHYQRVRFFWGQLDGFVPASAPSLHRCGMLLGWCRLVWHFWTVFVVGIPIILQSIIWIQKSDLKKASKVYEIQHHILQTPLSAFIPWSSPKRSRSKSTIRSRRNPHYHARNHQGLVNVLLRGGFWASPWNMCWRFYHILSPC